MSPSEDKQFSLSLFSIRRNTVQISLSMLLVLVLAILVVVVSQNSFNRVQDSLKSDLVELRQSENGSDSANVEIEATTQAISAGRTWLMTIGILSVALAGFAAFRLITVGLRSVALEVWIRRMGAGDLEYSADVGGRDEITELGIALEELRQRSIKAI